jgi:acetyl esterase/lipase
MTLPKYTIDQHRTKLSHSKTKFGTLDVPFWDFELFSIFNPYKERGTYPTLFYFPGTAFIASETSHTHFVCSHLAKLSNCQVIVIKHQLAPEWKPYEIIASTLNILKMITNPYYAKKFDIDFNKIAVAGYSSGGTLAAQLCLRAKNFKFKITRQILISPVLDLARISKGFEDFERQDNIISETFVEWFLHLYAPAAKQKKDPNLSPYWASKQQLAALPPTDIIVGEFDRFRGDAEGFGKKLSAEMNNSCLFMFKDEKHGLMWQNLQVTQAVAARVRIAFHAEPVRSFADPNEQKATILCYHFANRTKPANPIKPKASLKSPIPIRHNTDEIPYHEQGPTVARKAVRLRS